MSAEYDAYIIDHKNNVVAAAEWLRHNVPSINTNDVCGLGSNLWRHDDSKLTREEYDAYDEYFYGGEKTKEIKEAFNYAWLRHIHNNPHHWQYWVLINDDPEEGTIALDIPYKYAIEMICDWWSFSWKTGNLYEIFNWYDEHKKRMILSEHTRELVEEILGEIKKKLDELNAADKD